MDVMMHQGDGDVNEPIDAGPLAAVIEAVRTGPGCEELVVEGIPGPLEGGFWAEMWTVDAHGGPPAWPRRLVIRIAPDAESAARETAFQRAVASSGGPTPGIRAWGPPAPGLPRAYAVMDRVDGQTLLAGLDGIAALVHLRRVVWEMPARLARVMATLHGIDATAVHAEMVRAGVADTGVDGYLAWLADAALAADAADLVGVLDRLVGTAPPAAEVVVCHGDLHPFNVLASRDGDVLVDWTAARIAHPAFDVAFTALLLDAPPLRTPAPLDRLVAAVAHGVSRRFVRRYLQASERRIPDATLTWYRSLHCVRILVEVAQWRFAGTEADRAGHPWFAVEASVRRELGLAPRPG